MPLGYLQQVWVWNLHGTVSCPVERCPGMPVPAAQEVLLARTGWTAEPPAAAVSAAGALVLSCSGSGAEDSRCTASNQHVVTSEFYHITACSFPGLQSAAVGSKGRIVSEHPFKI